MNDDAMTTEGTPGTALDELQALEKAATSGPWRNVPHSWAERAVPVITDQGASVAVTMANDLAARTADAAFIAALRNAAPDLLAAARREAGLRAAADEVVALLLTSGKEPPPLNDYGLMSTLGFYAGPNARTAVSRETSDRFTALSKAVQVLRAALAESAS